MGTDKDGKAVVLGTGGYETVSRLEADGTWKVHFDTGGPDPPAPAKK